MATPDSLDQIPTPDDSIGLLEGIATTRSIRRYADEPVPESVLRDICFAASRAPTGSNRQQFRMIVLTDGDIAQQAKHLIAEGAQRLWSAKRRTDGYDEGSGITAAASFPPSAFPRSSATGSRPRPKAPRSTPQCRICCSPPAASATAGS